MIDFLILLCITLLAYGTYSRWIESASVRENLNSRARLREWFGFVLTPAPAIFTIWLFAITHMTILGFFAVLFSIMYAFTVYQYAKGSVRG